VLRPDSAHLFIGRKLAPLDFLIRGGKIGLFLGGQLNHPLIVASELQKEARDRILRFRGQGADGLDSLFEQLGHVPLYHKPPLKRLPG
jgi:hypothetical protein